MAKTQKKGALVDEESCGTCGWVPLDKLYGGTPAWWEAVDRLGFRCPMGVVKCARMGQHGHGFGIKCPE